MRWTIYEGEVRATFVRVTDPGAGDGTGRVKTDGGYHRGVRWPQSARCAGKSGRSATLSTRGGGNWRVKTDREPGGVREAPTPLSNARKSTAIRTLNFRPKRRGTPFPAAVHDGFGQGCGARLVLAARGWLRYKVPAAQANRVKPNQGSSRLIKANLTP